MRPRARHVCASDLPIPRLSNVTFVISDVKAVFFFDTDCVKVIGLVGVDVGFVF